MSASDSNDYSMSESDDGSDDFSSDFATGRCVSCKCMIGEVGGDAAEDEGVMINVGPCSTCLENTCYYCARIVEEDDGKTVIRSPDYFYGEWGCDLMEELNECCWDFKALRGAPKSEVKGLEKKLTEIAARHGYKDETLFYDPIDVSVDQDATYGARKFDCKQCCGVGGGDSNDDIESSEKR